MELSSWRIPVDSHFNPQVTFQTVNVCSLPASYIYFDCSFDTSLQAVLLTIAAIQTDEKKT